MGAHISAETLRDLRLNMVNGQLRTGGVVDQALLAAFLETPRERFVAPPFASLAYLDRELPALGAKARRLLPPMTLARMLQAAMVNPGERALDVGGGSGYGAAILGAMGAKVVALESDGGAASRALSIKGRPSLGLSTSSWRRELSRFTRTI
jgi:protein-L-isoaspartate(D-aspartate) O-methyltransferase